MADCDKFQTVREKMATAANKSERSPTDITLVAVSKKQPEARIDEALEAGQRVFGENRVQEAMTRWQVRRPIHPDLRLHLIGPLQTNKAAEAVALFDVIESLDREKLARVLAAEMQKQTRQLECFIQVNTGEEEQKTGIAPVDAVEFSRFCQHDLNLHVTGMMCIPPISEQPAMHFALLHTLAKRAGLAHLSMGMSGDFEEAIQFGATHIRVGSAFFGARI